MKENVSNNNSIKLEDAFARLEEINKALESQDVGLRESLELYSEGVSLVASCKETLVDVEKELIILNEV